MAYKPPVVVYDSCVLYPFHLRNLLIQCAVDRLVEARWTDEIHQEWMRSLAADRPGLTVERLRATRDLMKSVLPEADVAGYAPHIPEIELPDPDDRHVVAAALAGGASLIVTWNLRHFPAKELARYGLGRQAPDDLLIVGGLSFGGYISLAFHRAHPAHVRAPG
jgi:predicted nucleic acid-binding protein